MSEKNLYQGPSPGYAGSWGYKTELPHPVIGDIVRLEDSHSSDPRATAVKCSDGGYRVVQVHSLCCGHWTDPEITVTIEEVK